ncbi:MAG: hypothetical protein ACM3SQ_18455 [Betaproteobacteria bacterium]
MRLATISTVAVATAFCATTALAGQHGHPPVHPTVPHAAPTPHTAAPTHGGTAHATAPTSHRTTTHTSTSHAMAHGSRKGTHAGTTTSTGTTTGTASSPIATKIESHPQLASRLTAMLPQGMTLQDAAAGFRNQGQFIAALHVSQNLGIPFADLKQEMVTNHNSLGQSIQKLRPGTDATSAAHEGEVETEQDLDATGTKGTTSTATTKPKHGKGR